jgi:hypothetical protein
MFNALSHVKKMALRYAAQGRHLKTGPQFKRGPRSNVSDNILNVKKIVRVKMGPF